MNPSARGWLKKLLKFAEKNDAKAETLAKLYPALKSIGFIYGSNVSVLITDLKSKDFNQEECCKINFAWALLATYNCHSKDNTNFETTLKTFYETIGFHKSNFINGILGDDVESILNKRIQTDNNIFSKNFSLFVTNALLFMDVLAYNAFLKNPNHAKKYLLELENSIRTVVTKALNSKSKKNNYDESLIRLFEASLRLSKSKNNSYAALNLNQFSELERFYLLDLTCMATWNDFKIGHGEQEFFSEFSKKFKLSESAINEAIISVNVFYKRYENKISLLSTQNLAKRLYDHSSSVVKKLITRNSKRLYQELKESKDLVKLLSESTLRDLNEKEQEQMQEQMMDIIKSIPSLAIFMLPGGAILLPIFIKFIPKLLPSAFDENRIEEE
ncbi:MAG: hypothetical protein CMC77_04505 [Flavobacteriaceae bacterium]|nr:hypothetical protein [Flavobacteriaceae bacterium]